MKPFLMYRDRDFRFLRPPRAGLRPRSPSRPALRGHASALVQDLELETLFEAMAGGDEFLYDVAETAVLSSVGDPDTIVYRQDVLRDCLAHRDVVLEIHNLAVGALLEARRIWGGKSPRSLLYSSVSLVELFLGTLRSLRSITDRHAEEFASEGFRTLFGMLARELDDAYFREIEGHLVRLRFADGVLVSAKLGAGNKGTDYVLRRRPPAGKQSWLKRAFSGTDPYSFEIHPRDEAGARAMGELQERGIVLVANALAQSADHIKSFLDILRTELAFYLACTNLHGRLAEKGEPVCFPVPLPAERSDLSAMGLYDVCLTLLRDDRVVGNDVQAEGTRLVVITGANQGGKSTFLRSVGLAQLMMQSGMFVPAASFTANVCAAVFTHFKREEDVTMKRGKFDEELSRMSDIAESITPTSLLLFNESFASTNEWEGSQIAREIVRALLEVGVKIFYVTHLFDLAHSLFERKSHDTLFLRAEREADGRRTFRVVQGEPLSTSYGEDVYRHIFGPARRARSATRSK
jgi:hypothetical protein